MVDSIILALQKGNRYALSENNPGLDRVERHTLYPHSGSEANGRAGSDARLPGGKQVQDFVVACPQGRQEPPRGKNGELTGFQASGGSLRAWLAL
jgi:hypothetical protein